MFHHVPEFVDRILAFASAEGHGYDVIHSHYWLSGWAAQELRRVWGAPILQMFHTLGHMKNSVAQTESDLESDHRIEVEREIMPSPIGWWPRRRWSAHRWPGSTAPTRQE